jgi:hypothetical protein
LILNGAGEGNRTLIGLPKLFIGGKVSAAHSSPQPTVNNFVVAAKMICEKLPFRQKNGEHALSRRMEMAEESDGKSPWFPFLCQSF